MSPNKTRPTAIPVETYIAGVQPERRRRDAERLDTLFRRVTGWQPRMWGPSIIGYGRYHYRYASGREGDHLATGFAPRKAALVLYVMGGFEGAGEIMDRLGRYRTGRACLYVNRLDDVDPTVLESLIRLGLDRLGSHYPIWPE